MILLLQIPRAPGDCSSLSAQAEITVRSGRQSGTSKPFTCFGILSGVREGSNPPNARICTKDSYYGMNDSWPSR
jgi:hypothetical protein